MEQGGNLFSAIPGLLPEELFEELLTHKGLKIERIVSKGHASPEGFWYDQPENEWVLVVKGEARLRLWGQEKPVTLSAGSYLNLPAHVKHRVEWTTEHEETIWLAIFY
ncbi:cupin domain-containing protein [Larkinella insperata]|uniref:Cupin domain-containing protein n=1 Tax=Larkinella insperata TaxID=332158 RepID=A0ABW3QA69_9BACT|nr:cupin domain-containing protein [Larkinella insperata]